VNTSPITGGSRVGPQAVGVAGALGRLGRGRLGLIVQSWRSRWDVVNCRAERSTVPPENLAPSKVTVPSAKPRPVDGDRAAWQDRPLWSAKSGFRRYRHRQVVAFIPGVMRPLVAGHVKNGSA
jgi:hypothetical protein